MGILENVCLDGSPDHFAWETVRYDLFEIVRREKFEVTRLASAQVEECL